MGHEDEPDAPPHQVVLSPFFIGKFPITQAQYRAVMGKNPSHFKGDNLPVEQVSREDAVEFCERLSHLTSKKYRLPTEAEWEYACRAGSTTKYCFGDDKQLLGDYAWYDENSGNRTHPVGQKKPNAWGLHDMHGNVWEWCQDWYGANYYKESPRENPQGPEAGKCRVLRGGAWFVVHFLARAVYRNFADPLVRYSSLGFRVVSCVRPRPEALDTGGA